MTDPAYARPGLCTQCASQARAPGRLRCPDCDQQWVLSHSETPANPANNGPSQRR